MFIKIQDPNSSLICCITNLQQQSGDTLAISQRWNIYHQQQKQYEMKVISKEERSNVRYAPKRSNYHNSLQVFRDWFIENIEKCGQTTKQFCYCKIDYGGTLSL